jgi:hypothetical protein
MKTKIASYLKLSKALLSGLLCLTLSLPPYGFNQAQAAPADAGQAKCLDSQRMANYFKVIKGYLEELAAACNNAGEGAKGYIAKRVTEVIGGVNLYRSSPQDPDLAGYAVLLPPPCLDSRFDELNQQLAQSRNNNDTIIAFKLYLVKVIQYYQGKLTALPANYKAPNELFTLAKEGAKYAWNLNKAIPAYKVTYAQNYYLREQGLKQAYQQFYDDLYAAHVDTHKLVNYSGFKAIDSNPRLDSNARNYIGPLTDIVWLFDGQQGWGEKAQTVAKRTGRSSYDYRGVDSYMQWGRCQRGLPPEVYTDSLSVIGIPEVVSRHFYDITKMRNKFTSGEVYTFANSPERYDWRGLDSCDRNEILSRLTHPYEVENDYIKRQQAALGNLINTLNSILESFNAVLPYHTSYIRGESENNDAYIVAGGPTNRGPEIVDNLSNRSLVLEKEEKITDKKITLNVPKDKIKDPENDTLHYRWVILGMPETENAKSQKYALYQILSNEETCQFQPDLAGKWTLALEANDQELGLSAFDGSGITKDYALVRLNAIRHILWIQHSNGPYDEKTGLGISLELYQPIKDVTKPLDGEWGGPYYLEVAHEKAGVYLNYNDDGMPVDIIDINKVYLFKIERNKYGFPDNLFGAYDGCVGSTDLVRNPVPDRYHKSAGDFQLRSASSHKMAIPINVTVLDAQITDLVLSSAECTYGQPLGRSPTGTYSIQQWVDHYSWLNDHKSNDGKEGFVQKRGSNGVPDWLEMRAAEVLNETFPEALPYVAKILVENELEGRVGQYIPGRKDIYIVPTDWDIRYNRPGGNGYGFYGDKGWLDRCARHEAYHAFHWHTVGDMYCDKDYEAAPWRKRYPMPDGMSKDDGGKISGAPGNKFQYTHDSGENYLGPEFVYLPTEKKQQQPIAIDITYKGDDIFDYDSQRIMLEKVPYDINAEVIYKNIYLYQKLPNVPIEDVFIQNIYFLGKRKTCPVIWELDKNIHFYRFCNGLKSLTPDMQIYFDNVNIRRWVDSLKKNSGPKIIIDTRQLYIIYRVIHPFGLEEYDASRIEPASYTGLWGKKAIGNEKWD